jgi:hypothetical protein
MKTLFQGREKEISFPGRVEIFVRFIIRHANGVFPRRLSGWKLFLASSCACFFPLKLSGNRLRFRRSIAMKKFYREKKKSHSEWQIK